MIVGEVKMQINDKLMFCGSKVLKFSVDGEPVPQGRPRFGKGGVVYEPSKCTHAKANIRAVAEREMVVQGFAMAHKDMPIVASFTFYKSVPTSKPVWWKKAAKHGLVAPVVRNSDIDNCIKLCLDAINGVAFYDDAQVCEVHALARYSEKPRVDIEIKALYTNIGDIKNATKRLEGKKEKNDDV